MIQDKTRRHPALAGDCPRCDQKAGNPCRTVYIVKAPGEVARPLHRGELGRTMSRPHLARTLALIEARDRIRSIVKVGGRPL